ncbi:MAG: uroporphyrinogen decarboxylase [Bacteroidetes bacterium HGW-Bacteroidetes-5]|jgi:uroporphyrinogen decarboxylase|nr:MAG: uroporphyrinogen decarboxylase [Bacteroidetes bacterium HGW-Bacteroidetes-5]
MTGKELIAKAMKLEPLSSVPWVPFVGVHGASLAGVDSESYLNSKELIVRGVSSAIEIYKPDGIPVLFDLQLEAEALGCRVVWAKSNPPSVIGHPLTEGVDITDLKIPSKESGRIAVALEAVKEISELYPEVAIYGLVTGPFTLGLHLLGTDIFMQMFMDEFYVYDLMEFCSVVAKKMSDYYIEAGCDVIAIVDPMVSQIGTEQFDKFVCGYATGIFDHIRERGVLSSFFVCGDAQHNIESMCRCRPDNISVDENISLGYVRDIALEQGVSFGGNLKLTSTLLFGDETDCEKDAVECMEIGGSRGFILSPGCDLPYSTVVNNLKAVSEIVKNGYRREVVKAIMSEGNSELSFEDGQDYILKDDPDGPLKIDVITLDSASCAPCQYMMSAVLRAAEPFGERVVVTEHKIKERSGLNMMKRLGVKKIPTICIAQDVVFSSNIPPVDQIYNSIYERLKH